MYTREMYTWSTISFSMNTNQDHLFLDIKWHDTYLSRYTMSLKDIYLSRYNHWQWLYEVYMHFSNDVQSVTVALCIVNTLLKLPFLVQSWTEVLWGSLRHGVCRTSSPRTCLCYSLALASHLQHYNLIYKNWSTLRSNSALSLNYKKTLSPL